MKGHEYAYALLNLIAVSLVLLLLFNGWNLWSAIIQISRIILSFGGILRVWILTKASRFTGEERLLMATRFPMLSKLDARKLLNRGAWHDGGRCFQISSEALNRLSKANPELGAQLEFALAGDTRAKLIATNQLLQKELVRE